MNTHIHIYIYTRVCVCVCVCVCVYIYIHINEFTPMTNYQPQSAHSSFTVYTSLTPLSDNEKCSSHYTQYVYLIAQS